MSQRACYLHAHLYKRSLTALLLVATVSAQAIPTAAPRVTTADMADPSMVANQATGVPSSEASTLDMSDTLAAQLQPSNKALSDANPTLLRRNARVPRQVNDLQTHVNVLVDESKGQLFLYGAFTVLISLLVGIFVSWLVFVRRERW